MTSPMSETPMQFVVDYRAKPIAAEANVVNHWFWKFVPVDPLVFVPPNHEGGTLNIAREVHHRLLARIVAENAYKAQTTIVFLAWLATVLVGERFAFKGGDTVGFFLGLAAFAALLFFAVPVLMRLACPASARDEAAAIVRRSFFRELPSNTPPDLKDELQQGWLTVEGRPLSAEVSPEDGRTTEATRRSTWWILTALALGWAVSYLFVSNEARGGESDFGGFDGGPGGGGMFGEFASHSGSWMVLFLLVLKLVFDRRPLAARAMELALSQSVEGVGFVAAGGSAWGAIPEAARQRQIKEAANDPTFTVQLGQTTGVFAGRGDFYGPGPGLPFRLSLRDLQMHMLVLGGTGSGKTSGALRPLARQVCDHESVGLVVMDGKGALPRELSGLSGMRVVDPGTAGTDVSLVSGVEPAVIVDTIREILAPAGAGHDAFWVNSAAGALRRGALIAQAAGGDWWTLFNAAHVVSNKADRDQLVDALMPQAEDNPLLREAFVYFRQEWDGMDEKTRSNILAEVRSWISTITATPELLRWAKTPAGRDTVDILSPLRGGRIGVLIPEYRYGVAGAVVTALVKARLYSGLKSRAERRWEGTGETPVVFVVDEAQEVATTQDAQMLPIGRSLGLAVVAATQGVEGIHAKLGEKDAPKWLSIFGTVLALSGRSRVTDEFVASRAGESWQLAPSEVEGGTVRSHLSVEALAGPLAAARTQPHMARAVGTTGWTGIVSRIAAAMGFRPKPFGGKRAFGSRLALGPRPVVATGEIASLVAVPDTAIVLATRGRVPRRDLIRLSPEYPGQASELRLSPSPPALPSDATAPAAA